jgi:acetyl-CoA decarbonylase/synthase complex subunit delta
MKIDRPVQKGKQRINVVALGKTPDEGGTRKRKVAIGGGASMPFIGPEDGTPNRPAIAMDVHTAKPELQGLTLEELGAVVDDPVAWARACETEWDADLVCLKFTSANPQGDDSSAEECASIAKEVLKAVGAPLMLYGCGDEAKDAAVMSALGDIVRKEGCVIGMAENEKYKSMAAAAMAYNAHLVAFSNLDINLAKQLNILLSEFGMPTERIIMDPLQGALGYGVEYSFSVIERIRLAALSGDATIKMPMVCDASIAHNYREAYEPLTEWGDPKTRGLLWEGITATSSIMAGADLVILRAPSSVRHVRRVIDQLSAGGGT